MIMEELKLADFDSAYDFYCCLCSTVWGRNGLAVTRPFQYEVCPDCAAPSSATKKNGGLMRVLVACEFSGIVREAFKVCGHNAWSIDLLPTDIDGQHIVGDVRNFLNSCNGLFDWDLMIAHPPCTHLAVSGARWFKAKPPHLQKDALDFVRLLMNAPIPRICIENPISIISSKIRKPDQIIQPWMFGHGEIKATCLWLKGLPCLKPTKIVRGRQPRVHHVSPSPDRWKERSRTLLGIAKAMAEQWG